MAKDLESRYQTKVCDRLREMFPGCMIIRLDPNYIQGIPDWLLLWKERWATLEIKRDPESSHRPNQDYYVDKMNNMSFSAFIFPENEERVLYELQLSFES